MNTSMLGESRSMNSPMAEIAYLQQRPIRLMPSGLRRRLSRVAVTERSPRWRTDARDGANRAEELAGR